MYVICINCNNWFRKTKDSTILTCSYCEPLYIDDIKYEEPYDKDSIDDSNYIDSKDDERENNEQER